MLAGINSDGALRGASFWMNADLKAKRRRTQDTLLPFEVSVGYQIRLTHRLIQRALQKRIEPHGVTLGMWYFLRALWREDGLTQSELSSIAGTMEPTTLTAIKAMEKGGLVRRVRNSEDRRKINIYLTQRGLALKKELLPLAMEVVDAAVAGFTAQDKKKLFGSLRSIQTNIWGLIEEGDELTSE